MRRPSPRLSAALAVLALSAAGSAAAVPAGAASQKARRLKLSADAGGALKFNKTRLTTRRGRVTIVMSNPSRLRHGIAVEGHGVDKDGKVVRKGHASRVTVRLKRGRYEFYCPVKGHKAAGMEGTLVVR
jgi:uncharacterized cupredoxin-like copper-binding protein